MHFALEANWNNYVLVVRISTSFYIYQILFVFLFLEVQFFLLLRSLCFLQLALCWQSFCTTRSPSLGFTYVGNLKERGSTSISLRKSSLKAETSSRRLLRCCYVSSPLSSFSYITFCNCCNSAVILMTTLSESNSIN